MEYNTFLVQRRMILCLSLIPPVAGSAIVKVVCALFLAVVLFAAPQSSAEARTLELVNRVGESIKTIKLNGHYLGGLPVGGSSTVELRSGSIFDLSIILSSGRDVYWDDLNLSNVWRLTFVRNGSAIRVNFN